MNQRDMGAQAHLGLQPPAPPAYFSTERVVSAAQDTPNESKLAPHPDEGYDSKCNATTEGGGSKVLP